MRRRVRRLDWRVKRLEGLRGWRVKRLTGGLGDWRVRRLRVK